MTTPTHTPRAGVRPVGPLLRTGLPAVLLAGVATTTLAAAGRAVGISPDVAGEPIPVPGFGVLTVAFGLVGVLLAVALSRWSRHPRRAFVTAARASSAGDHLVGNVTDENVGHLGISHR